MIRYQGLTTKEVKELQRQHGKNELSMDRKNPLVAIILHTVKEPIFILLTISSIIYFFLGEAAEGIIMLAFVIGIIAMDTLQEWKTDKVLTALKKLSQPLIHAIRDEVEVTIGASDLVPGDIILVEEGCKIPADGYVISSHDFCTDESLLTGESGDVWKTSVSQTEAREGCEDKVIRHTSELVITEVSLTREDYCYAGTLVTQGNARICIDKIGSSTIYGKIGRDVASAPMKATPLQQQMKSLTSYVTWIALLLFILVSAVTYLNLLEEQLTNRIIQSLLAGIVLSLSMIPAEFPVILTVFLSMGALRLTKKNALIRKLPSVETLGAVSVICVDKTGTITKNEMEVKDVWLHRCEEERLIATAALACDWTPHDSMEKAILLYGNQLGIMKEDLFSGKFIMGYPFTQECKTMAHVWEIDGTIRVAAKGSPEWIFEHCLLSSRERIQAEKEAKNLSKRGLRVIAVGSMDIELKEIIPSSLMECQFQLYGLIGFLDPPKEFIGDDIRQCREAGIRVVMITGDNGDTAAAIARQIQLPLCEDNITGQEVSRFSDIELQEAVKTVNIFSRVIPEQKMRIVKALQENGAIVGMTGDGVNDAPALKNADIGIAMGLKGSEVTREAADLVLLDDNFSTIISTIKDARRIYHNIQKAIGYVFTIHIPIALACLIGPLLQIKPENLMLLPLHIVLLELIMNPTCSTVLERQPADIGIMEQGPRSPKTKLFNKVNMLKSILQGITIFTGSFGLYYLFLRFDSENITLARTVGLSVLIISNILLIIVNSSETEKAYNSAKRLMKDRGIIIIGIITILLLLFLLYSPITKLLMLTPLNGFQLFIVILTAFVSVFWYEVVKRLKYNKKQPL